MGYGENGAGGMEVAFGSVVGMEPSERVPAKAAANQCGIITIRNAADSENASGGSKARTERCAVTFSTQPLPELEGVEC
jgi:hypothetical protein